MINTKTDFSERRKEINLYFDFLEDIIDKKAILQFKKLSRAEGPPQVYKPVNRQLIHTLKANGYLLLYNAVESTMKNAIEAIHNEFVKNEVEFNDLGNPLQKKIIRRFREAQLKLDDISLSPISLEIINAGFDKSSLFSGNVDAKKIREIAEAYGFSHQTDPRTTDGGRRLVDVKYNRNHLAHGNVSFSECGQETSIEDLVNTKAQVLSYLETILQNIETYLENMEYVANT